MINTGITQVSLGALTTKINLYKPHQTKNERGAIESEFVINRSVFAKVVENPVSEQQVDSNLIALNTIEVTMYIVPQLTTAWRVEYNGKFYNIISQNKAERQPIMVVRAEQMME